MELVEIFVFMYFFNNFKKFNFFQKFKKSWLATAGPGQDLYFFKNFNIFSF